MTMLAEIRPGDWAVYEAWWDPRPKTVIYLGPDDEREDRAWVQESMASGFPFICYQNQISPVATIDDGAPVW